MAMRISGVGPRTNPPIIANGIPMGIRGLGLNDFWMIGDCIQLDSQMLYIQEDRNLWQASIGNYESCKR
jgi:hypothetical protein